MRHSPKVAERSEEVCQCVKSADLRVVIAMEAPRLVGQDAANNERASRDSGRWRLDLLLTCAIFYTRDPNARHAFSAWAPARSLGTLAEVWWRHSLQNGPPSWHTDSRRTGQVASPSAAFGQRVCSESLSHEVNRDRLCGTNAPGGARAV